MGLAVVGEPVDVDGTPATSVDLGNPHAVLPVPSVEGLGELKTSRLDLNVEYVEDTGPASISMRVHERGVGETRSCGTGACAAVVATSLRTGDAARHPLRRPGPGRRSRGHLARGRARAAHRAGGPAGRGRAGRGLVVGVTGPLTPAQAAAATKQGIGDFGFAWMADPAGRARGKAELGLRGRPLYHLGRCGVLGDVPVEVVVAVEAFFPPAVVRAAWEEGRALVEPHVAAAFYAGLCADHARGRFADSPDTARLVHLVEHVVDAAPSPGCRCSPAGGRCPGRTTPPAGSACC
jgi:hypothetical protein